MPVPAWIRRITQRAAQQVAPAPGLFTHGQPPAGGQDYQAPSPQRRAATFAEAEVREYARIWQRRTEEQLNPWMWRVEQQPIQGTQTSGFYATADAMLTQQLYGGIANMPEYGGTATMAARKEQKFDSVSLESVASLVPRQSITDFSKLMEYRLTQHDHWGGWDDVGIWALYDQLQNAYNEAYYSLALRRYDRYEGNDKAGTIHSNAPHADVPKIARYVAEQFADVANYAMMIAENAQRLADEYTKGKK